MSNSFFTPGTFMNTTTLGQNLRVRQDIAGLRSRITEAQTQLSSGFKAQTHGGLGASSTVAQELRHRLGRLEGYRDSISTVNMRLFTVQKGLNTVQTGSEKLAETTQAVYAPGFPESIQHSRVEARSVLATSVSVLNMNQGNRFLFSGADVSTKPVIDPDTMINGGGGRMGLTDTMALRLQADMGTGTGRLATTPGPAADEVTLTHDGGVFGMRPVDITGPGATAPTQTGAVTTGSVDVSAIGAGQSVTLSFEMPDGSTSTITLTAGAAAGPTNAKDSYTFVAGDATSFQAMLDDAITTIVDRDMTGASAIAAGSDFFDHQAPRIPDGDPATATGLAISSGTVVDWYVGESAVPQVKGPAVTPTAPVKGDTYLVDTGATAPDWIGMDGMLATFNGIGWTFTKPEVGTRVIADDPVAGQPALMYAYDGAAWTSTGQAPTQTSARDSVRAKVDDNLFVSHGARADEPGVRDNLKAAALMVAADLDTAAPEPFQQVARKVTTLLNDAHSSIVAVQAELGVVQERLGKLEESHKDFKSLINNQVMDVEGVDDYELATRLQDLLSRLEGSYQIVSRLQSMSLTNYI